MDRVGNLRVQNSPRSLILSTGEDIPRGHSLRARAFILEVEEGMIASKKLHEMQGLSRDGYLAQAMSGYLKWLAANGKIKEGFADSEKQIAF